jgi:AbrB family looped-hinge helix DNA binding protein
MAVSVKMSSKNQIVVPKEAREALDLQPGDRLVVSVRDDGVLEMERQPRDLGRELEGTLSELATAGAGERGLWEELDHE